MKIKDLSESERPRERLHSSGPQALSNGELLAVLLRSGTASANVLEVSRSLLRSCDGRLVRLSQMDGSELQRAPGVGASKAAVIMAAFELGRRFADERSGSPGRPITGARTVYDMMAPYLKGVSHEECWVLLLDKRQRVCSRERVSAGTADEVLFDPREVIRLAMSRGARALILVHNHPAGNPEPSSGDIQQTQTLARAASACGLRLLDHIIVADESFYSFSDEKLYSVLH
ncbi:MAG: DNA repair protein RadC [Bacteroidales bacterium]|nr:DNA repair protein RadC [Bacteroidales bacterium]